MSRVSVSLWRLATPSDDWTIGHLFGTSKSSVGAIVQEFCDVMSKKLLLKYINIPTGGRLEMVVGEFKSRWVFPQCVGAIDGSHIPIKAPADFHADYYNRKGWYSIILQAIVNSSFMLDGPGKCMMPDYLPIL